MRFIILSFSLAAGLLAQRFYSDDPLEREPAPVPLSQAASRKLSDYYDLFSNQFHEVGERQPKSGPRIPAKGANTLGEPMEGSWWQKRHYYHRMTRDELMLGPGQKFPPSKKGKWSVVAVKAEGVTPGFTIIDPEKRRYFVKFDPPANPEMATAADSIGARFFYALGYYVPDNYIVYFKPEQLELASGVQVADELGKKHPISESDLKNILARVRLNREGELRATASLAVEGQPIGPPRYYGTRADDPNDIVPHEHRRELRGLQVFCAWIDHDDSRAINNLDAILTIDGVQSIRHYLLDFGSTLGSASNGPNSVRSGAYYFSWKESAIQLFTLGLKPQYWALAHYPNYPSIGRFEWQTFDPQKWVPEYPNVAFHNRLPDDEFWAAKQVMAFTDEDIDAIVATGKLSDPMAASYLARCLRERRNKIGRAYFAKVLPFDRFRVENGRLAWDDLAATHDIATADDVRIRWSNFDNKSGTKTPVAGAEQAMVPLNGDYVVAELSAESRPRQTVSVYLRRQGGSASVVGIDRTW